MAAWLAHCAISYGARLFRATGKALPDAGIGCMLKPRALQ